MRLIALIVCVFLVSACAQEQTKSQASTASRFKQTTKDFGNDATVTFENTDFQTPRRIERQILAETKLPKLNKEDLILAAEIVLQESFSDYELELLHVRKTHVFDYVSYQQEYLERPIHGSRLTLRMDRSGEWITANSSLVSVKLLKQIESKATVKEIDYSFLAPGQLLMKTSDVLYPQVHQDKAVQIHMAQEAQVYDPDTQSAFILWMDEHTGELIDVYHPDTQAQQIRIKGSILPNSIDDSPEDVFFPKIQFKIEGDKYFAEQSGDFNIMDFLGKAATINLENKYLAVVDNAGPNNELLLDLSEDILREELSFDDNSSLEERNIYYWVMKARAYLEDNLDFHEMDYQLVAMAHFQPMKDNAFFNPLLKVLAFGEGEKMLKNTALSRDVILHEFGHAVTHQIYGIKTGYEFSAMNEAFSDYLAATITNDPTINENGMANGMPYLRTVESDYTYKTFFKGDYFHRDGQLFSGALWRLRKAVGAELADKMIHEARLSQAGSIQEFYQELRLLDEALDDGDEFTRSPNARAIRKSFMAHGLHSEITFSPKKEDFTTPWKKASHHNCWTH